MDIFNNYNNSFENVREIQKKLRESQDKYNAPILQTIPQNTTPACKTAPQSKPTTWQNIGAFLAGNSLMGFVFFVGNSVRGLLAEKFFTMPEPFSKESTEKIAQAMVKTSGLDKKGFKYVFVNDKNYLSVEEALFKELSAKALRKNLNRIKDSCKNLVAKIKEGKNACFIPSLNKAFAGDKKSFYILHEIGHAINSNSSKLIKHLITGGRMASVFGTGLIGFVGLAHTINKEKEQKTKRKFEKTLDFIKNNAGKLVLMCFVPILGEEALATGHALKYTNKILGKKAKAGALGKIYGVAFSTYATTAIVSILATKAGIALRDEILEPGSFKRNRQQKTQKV